MRKNRLGIWPAIAVIVIGGMYVVTLGAGVAVHGLATPIGDPILAIMEFLTLLSALVAKQVATCVFNESEYSDTRSFPRSFVSR